MAVFRVWRLREVLRQSFKNQEHKGGAVVLKPKDYTESIEIEGESAYAAWSLLKDGETKLEVGDALADSTGKLHIFKYIGFEPAEWQVIEPKQNSDQATLIETDANAAASNTIEAVSQNKS
jgi:hypothetical protein